MRLNFRRFLHQVRMGTLTVGCVLLAMLPARTSGISQPTGLRVLEAIQAGDNVPIQVTLSEPGEVHLTSVPSGIVDCHTTISSTSAIISVPTNGSAPSGSATIVLTSAGPGSVSQDTAVENVFGANP